MQLRITPAVKWLAIACLAMFLIQKTGDQFFGAGILPWLALIPKSFVFDLYVWQIFTYSFLHADVLHLALNLMMLVFIGSEIEVLWGTKRFLRFYFICVFFAGLAYLALQMLVWKDRGLITPMVGASGGIYGLLMAYGILFAERQLLFMMLFPLKAKHFVWILVGVEFMTTVFSERGGLSGAAHLGGMVAGFGYLWAVATYSVLKKKRALGKKAKRRASNVHLKLVIDNDKTKPPKVQVGESDDGDPKTWH